MVASDHTESLVPVVALTCHHWYGLSLTYVLNNLGIKLPAINKCQVYKVVKEISTQAFIGGIILHVVCYLGCIQ